MNNDVDFSITLKDGLILAVFVLAVTVLSCIL